jgi:hypothetical protein
MISTAESDVVNAVTELYASQLTGHDKRELQMALSELMPRTTDAVLALDGVLQHSSKHDRERTLTMQIQGEACL